MKTIFTVNDSDIKNLSPDRFVEFYQEMLWADARRIKLPITKINISTKINVPDGGIDASVEDAAIATGDLIVDKDVFYQIKAGENFAPWQESEIKKELFDNKEIKKEHLASYVKECFEKNGTYVVVCPKVSLTPQQRSQSETHIKGMISKCGFSDPKVQVWGQDKIIGTLQRFPSLALKITGRDRAHFQSHSSWSEDEEMRKSFLPDKEQERFIEALRKELRNDNEAVHISVYGEPGIGKTRLVLEATKEKDIRPLVIYCDSPSKFRNSDLENVIINDNDIYVILVIDECDHNARSYIWNKLANKGPRIKLITIYNESEKLNGTMKLIEAPKLSDKGISSIIQQYHGDKFQADRVAKLCGGIPRFAHALGLDLKNNPGEFFRTPDTNNLWDRYISGGDDSGSPDVKQRKRVLLVLSLFTKFGHGTAFQDEMNAIHTIIQKMDNSITLAIYQEIIKLLQRRRILQGVDTLYISPKALHLKLWIEYWDTYTFDFETLKQFSPKLREWFSEMFAYADKSEGASKIVKEILGPNGWFKTVKDIESRLGARLFLALAKSDPQSALEYLKNTIGKMSSSDLLQFTEGRREAIYALERIVWEKELFDDGARLLLALAEAENESWANNATGIFAGLFSHAPGKVSMTKTPPKDRLKILKEALCDKSKERRKVGFKACKSALQTHHFIRASGIDPNELRLDDEGWTPQSVDELVESYKNVIEVMVEKLKDLPDDEQKEVIDLISGNARGLLSDIPKISNFVLDKIEILAKNKNANRQNILQAVMLILEFDGEKLEQPIKQRLEKLEEEFTGNDFASQMKRYVGMDMMVDLVSEAREKAREEKIKELAKESLNIQKLKPELKWLVTIEAKYGFMFGYELGKLDEKMNLLPTLLDAQKNAGDKGSGFFLSGYYLAIYERDKARWEAEIESLAKQDDLLRYFMEISSRSGITDKIGLLILELAKDNKIKPIEFVHFRYASFVSRLSEEVFKKWIVFLTSFKEKEIVFLALDLFYSYFVHRKSKPLDKNLTLGLLTRAVPDASSRSYVMDGYHWVETAKAFVEQFPDDRLQVAEVILSHLERGTFFDAEHRQIEPILNEIAYQNPLEVWRIVTKYIGPPLDSRAYRVLNWIRGGMFETQSSFIEYVPLDEIWKWVDVDKEKRAPYLARFSPPVLKKERCLSREILARYGEMESVQRELLANFNTGFFSGPASQHYENKKEKILEFKNSENNEKVRKWVDMYARSLDSDIKRFKKSEEREL